MPFLVHALLELLLAVALGAVIAYHPRSRVRVDSIAEVEAPKIYLTYAVVGAVIGLMVVEYGMVVGLVVFGIGGLFRFRTTLASAAATGRLILVTLVGLSCGLELPHLGGLATAFGFVLIYVTDRVVTYQIDVKDLEKSRLVEAADVYRGHIAAAGAEIIREQRRFSRGEVAFVVRAPNGFGREALERTFEREIPAELQGAVDWQVD